MSKYNFKNITLEKLAAIVSGHLAKHNIDSILVGGGCVSIYSQNRYQSYDLDYVTYEDMKKITIVLSKLGFQKESRYFKHKDCQYIVEFIAPPVAIGREPIQKYEYHKTSLGTIKMLTPTDSVKDRLASYYHWDDQQGLNQAISIYREIPDKVDIKEIKRWSKKEDQAEKCEIFLKYLKENSKKKF